MGEGGQGGQRGVVAEVILPHFRVRPFCVVVSSSLWNPEVLGSNPGTDSALGTSIGDEDVKKKKKIHGMLCGHKFHHRPMVSSVV